MLLLYKFPVRSTAVTKYQSMANNESRVIRSIQGHRIEEKRGKEGRAKKMNEYNIQFYLVTFHLDWALKFQYLMLNIKKNYLFICKGLLSFYYLSYWKISFRFNKYCTLIFHYKKIINLFFTTFLLRLSVDR